MSKLQITGIVLFVLIMGTAAFSAAQPQSRARYLGGEMDHDLPAGEKLVEVTWKDDSLWFLTREMKDGEEAEDYTFSESDNLGVLEGRIYIHEHKAK